MLTQLHSNDSISRFISPQPISRFSPAALQHIKHAQPISPADLLPCSTHGSRNEMIEEKRKKKKKSVKALKQRTKERTKNKTKKRTKQRKNKRTNEKKEPALRHCW
jgi:hypothetical protein